MIQCARTKQRRRKESEDDSNETDTEVPEVDLYQLQVNTLRRYKRHFKVSTRPGLNKAQLADVSTTEFYLTERFSYFTNTPLSYWTIIEGTCSEISRNIALKKCYVIIIRQVYNNR